MEVVNDMLVFKDWTINKWWAIPLDYFFGAEEKESKLVVSFFIADNGSYAEAVVDQETYDFVNKTIKEQAR
ncbi:hypothetical protein F5ESL0236_07565 [Lactobacillus sp. ESL0236]|uniref:hypothetical protein n=1 Tax=unclassified Lactobacillus TaxID=2620435 RepID=UPI000EFD5E3B|nr:MULTISPECIES: hypothetical protein [unclassified Lactobacillus]RMC36002.1 hypothetical protein F5ESL0237_08140 [Lactobacillus sp. ESL0237]RMC42498.1 hypothetical protein F5ESL0234_07975 [Lactobacillus sp. ESL0234]RMC43493.1 hypothetical protein F5ESL0236_07565 [Lactobacillus sp. ESL0236]